MRRSFETSPIGSERKIMIKKRIYAEDKVRSDNRKEVPGRGEVKGEANESLERR